MGRLSLRRFWRWFPVEVTIDDAGRARIATIARWALDRRGRPMISSARVSMVTVNRILHRERVSEAMLHAVGSMLDLPDGFLVDVGHGDLERIARSDAEAELRGLATYLISVDRRRAW